MMLKTFSLAAMLLAAPIAASAEQIRLLAFGDSLTEGYGLKSGEGLVPQLQSWLRARGHDVLILNGGLSGDTTAGGRIRIGYSIARHRPDAVIVELGGNDLIYGMGAKGAEANLDSILEQAGADARPILLVGIANPRADTNVQAEWAAIWPRLAKRHGTLLDPNLYAPIFSLPETEWPRMVQGDGVHPSPDGVKRIVEALGPKVEELLETVSAQAAPATTPDTTPAASGG